MGYRGRRSESNGLASYFARRMTSSQVGGFFVFLGLCATALLVRVFALDLWLALIIALPVSFACMVAWTLIQHR